MPVLAGSAVWMTPATSPSVMRPPPPPVLRTPRSGRHGAAGRACSAVISAGFDALGLGEPADVLVGRRVEIDHALWDSRGRSRSSPCRRRARSAACRLPPSPWWRSRPACSWRTASCLRADRPRCRPSVPACCRPCSPMNSIGASSRSPSPITTVPSIGSLLSSRRMASTAAWSAGLLVAAAAQIAPPRPPRARSPARSRA